MPMCMGEIEVRGEEGEKIFLGTGHGSGQHFLE